MYTMTRAEFSALPGVQQVDGEITFEHGPERAAIHHAIRQASVQYVLSQYPAFDSIRIDRIAAQPGKYVPQSRTVVDGRGV